MNELAVQHGMAFLIEGYGTNKVTILGPEDHHSQFKTYTDWTQSKDEITFDEQTNTIIFCHNGEEDEKLLDQTKEEYDLIINGVLQILQTGSDKKEYIYLKQNDNYIDFKEFMKNV